MGHVFAASDLFSPLQAVILIPTLNRPDDLRRTLAHVLPVLDEQLGLVLVDDASTDPAHRALLAEVAQQAHVQVVRLGERHGCTRARRVVLETLEVPFVIMLDDDSHFIDATRQDLDKMLQRFDDAPRMAVQALPCFVPSRDAGLGDVLGRIYDGRLVSGFINCACVVRMDAYRAIGGYRVEFDSPYGEERDLSIRFLDQGWTIRQFVGPAVEHQQSIAARNKEHNARGNALNYLRFIWWYHPAWLATSYTVTTLVKLIRNGLRYGQSIRGVYLGVADFGREVMRGLPARRVRAETLKAFYSLKRRRATTVEELAEIQQHSWWQVLYEQMALKGSRREEGARTPRWWRRPHPPVSATESVVDIGSAEERST